LVFLRLPAAQARGPRDVLAQKSVLPEPPASEGRRLFLWISNQQHDEEKIMLHMDIWITLVCSSIIWGALWSAAQLARRGLSPIREGGRRVLGRAGSPIGNEYGEKQ